MNKRIKILVLVVAWGVLAMGCSKKPAVVITYTQRMNFEVFDPDPAAQPHQTYGGGCAVFYIKSIKNPSGGETYQFKPGKLYINDTSNSGWDLPWAYHVFSATWRAGDKTVTAGQTATNLGCVVVSTGGEAKNFAYFLNHDSSVDKDSVLMVREGEAQANIFNPGTAFKDTLQQNCQP